MITFSKRAPDFQFALGSTNYMVALTGKYDFDGQSHKLVQFWSKDRKLFLKN